MKVQVETLKNSEVKLTVEISDKKMQSYKKEAAEELQTKVQIPGFRPGSIPMEMIERHLGEQAFMGHVLDIAITATYEEAIKDEKIRPVAYPKLTVISHDPLKYEAIVAVVPEVKWKKDIAKLIVHRKKLEVKPAEIEEVLKNLQKRAVKWEFVDRAAKKNDRVEVDFQGFDMDGKELEGTQSQNHPVILGEGSLIPGFEEEIVGMKKDEEKDFEIVFPKDYHADHFKGKKVKFHVKLNSIEEPESRELDDEFVKEITGGNRNNVQELKEEIKEELMHQKEHQEEAELEAEFLKTLVEYVDAEIPDALLDREIDFMVDRMKQDLEKRKMTWDDYEKEMKEKGKDIREELKKPAMDNVKIRLGLEKIHDEVKIEVSNKAVEEELDHMLGHYPPELKPMLMDRYKKDGHEWNQLKAQLMLKELVKHFTK